jgi:hypothetical protein
MFKVIQLDKLTTVKIGVDLEITQEQDFIILAKEDILKLAKIIQEEEN